jgi:tyrosinase
MATVRKSTSDMQPADWDLLIDAINKLHGTGVKRPAYRDFVKVHTHAMKTAAGMAWQVHTMNDMGMKGINFLAWHRQMLIRFEQRLQQVHASAFIPYWDWIANPKPPAQISKPVLLDSWSVDRDSDLNLMPSAADVRAVKDRKRFPPFQFALETGPHNAVHVAIGGDMNTPGSPADPIFYMHHANVDRLWYEWQKEHPEQNPPNMDEVLEPNLLMNKVRVSGVVDRTALPYSYA